jgi:hypothetical protein
VKPSVVPEIDRSPVIHLWHLNDLIPETYHRLALSYSKAENRKKVALFRSSQLLQCLLEQQSYLPVGSARHNRCGAQAQGMHLSTTLFSSLCALFFV